MEEFYIEPDPGQQTTKEVDDLNDVYYKAFKYKQHAFIDQIRVLVIECERLYSLPYRSGHRVRIVIENIG